MHPKYPILILPGLSSSGPNHWQTLWEQAHPQYRRVEQQDWFDPNPANWVANIERSIQACTEPPILVAHSLATIAICHWAQISLLKIRGAMLVAPADVESPNPHYDLLVAFRPIPLSPLPFPSLLIASTNDPYAKFERVQQFAQAWGSELQCIGAHGHINSDSGLGTWPQGQQILAEWISRQNSF
jgi:predicted alpha/beta hydrolase family esterase